MNVFTQSISQIYKGAVKAFKTFPTAIASAVAFSIVTMIRIQLDWPQQEDYNFLFNCLHWAFAMGAIFSLAVITASQSRFNQVREFVIANILGAVAVVVTFLALYLYGGIDSGQFTTRVVIVSSLAATRVSVAIIISLLAFIIMAGYPKDQSDFAHSLFMTQKAFFIALIYGVVIMAGTSGIASAIQALLFRDMSSKVYMYLGTLTGFLSFTIFIGYFPDFRKGNIDEHRGVVQKQPRFVEILFGYIMIPIVLALTVVLLIWTVKTILGKTEFSFTTLAGIATGYTAYGIWLHIMVTHSDNRLTKFYRRIYPIAALVILAFEARSLLIELQKTGLKTVTYYFILIWIIAVVASILLIVMKSKAHPSIVILTCMLAVFSVLPVVGYRALPVTAQVNRLESLLVSQGMLEGDQLIPATDEPALDIREQITDAVNYLVYAEDAKLPTWFDKRLGESEVFETKLGFAQMWPEPEYTVENGGYIGTSLVLPNVAVDISNYSWSVQLQNYVDGTKENFTTTIDGDKGLYKINWTINPLDGIPILKIKLDDRVILEQDMNDYINQISKAFPPNQSKSYNATLKDMSLQLETPEVNVLLVFKNIEINVDSRQDIINYWLNLHMLYLKEK